MPPHSAVVSALTYYPIKSCMGIDLSSAEIDERGIADDRGWMLVGDDNIALTQRDLAAMVHISAQIVPYGTGRALLLRAPAMPDLSVPEVDTPGEQEGTSVRGANACHEQLTVTVWDDPCQAVDQGLPASQWLSSFLKHKTRLVRMSRSNKRAVALKKKESFEGIVGFADVYPFLVISTASLTDLNQRLKEPVPMNRFRPNIVIDGVEPFAEDTWTRIKIGSIEFSIDKPCARCVVVTIDQESAEQFKEPLATLATYRREADNKVMFGQNAVHNKIGTIKVGDCVEILKVR